MATTGARPRRERPVTQPRVRATLASGTRSNTLGRVILRRVLRPEPGRGQARATPRPREVTVAGAERPISARAPWPVEGPRTPSSACEGP